MPLLVVHVSGVPVSVTKTRCRRETERQREDTKFHKNRGGQYGDCCPEDVVRIDPVRWRLWPRVYWEFRFRHHRFSGQVGPKSEGQVSAGELNSREYFGMQSSI
uniref:(northern house mosquito) hypothetical protein n=1 Tax=Culex pipiens TaxID=7175 RepID=A0A8D8H9A4_CULPI